MLAASCFSRISIRFRGPVLSIQALNSGPSRREPIARGTLCAATYFSACAGYLGHIGTKVRPLDMTAAKRVNTTAQLHTISEAEAGTKAWRIAIVRAVRQRESQPHKAQA